MILFAMYASPDSGFSSPIASSLPSCSAFDPLMTPTRITSLANIRRRLSYESIDTPVYKDAATQTEPELSADDIERCREVGRRLLALCDDFDREFFQPTAQSETTPSSSYPAMIARFVRSLF